MKGSRASGCGWQTNMVPNPQTVPSIRRRTYAHMLAAKPHLGLSNPCSGRPAGRCQHLPGGEMWDTTRQFIGIAPRESENGQKQSSFTQACMVAIDGEIIWGRFACNRGTVTA